MIGRFVRGAKTLNINSGLYGLDINLVATSTPVIPQIASGLAANEHSGGRKIGEKAGLFTWQFDVDISGSGRTEVIQAISDLRYMLNQAGDENEPLYFEWKADSLVEPVWGQFGAVKRYKVLSASMEYTLFALAATCNVELTLNPYAEGNKQRLGSAKGGIIEDMLGSLDGISRGLIIPEYTVNKVTNPIFGNADWDLNWNAGAGVIVTQNIDPVYCLPGSLSSAKIIGISGSDHYFIIGANVGNTNKHSFSVYIMLADKSTPTSAIIQLDVNSSYVNPTFQNLGNGLYCAYYDNFDGVASSQAFGVGITSGYTVYLLGTQIEEKAYHTILCQGNMLGCIWNGTSHNSTSSRTAANLKVAMGDTGLSAGEGSIVMAIRLDTTQAHPNAMCLFDLRDGSNTNALFSLYDFTVDKFYFSYNGGANSIISGAQTFPAGSIFVLHFVWGNGVMGLYLNGVTIDDDYAYIPKSLGADLWIGSDYSSATQLVGPILGFCTFKRKLTTAEVVADYASILENISSGDGLGRKLEAIPWLWTKDGDDVIDPFDDSDQDNYVVCGGIPGTDESDTEWILTPSSADKSFWLGRHAVALDRFCYPTLNEYHELDGTADTAGTASGDAHDEETVGGGNNLYDNLNVNYPDTYKGTIHFFLRAKSSGATTINARPNIKLSNVGAAISGKSKTLPLYTSYFFYYVGSMETPDIFVIPAYLRQLYLGIDYQGDSTILHRDFELFINGPVLFVERNVVTGPRSLLINNRTAIWTNPSGGLGINQTVGLVSIRGEPVNLLPNCFNKVWSFCVGGYTITSIHPSDVTIAFSQTFITPRYSLV